jgi:hypothetical protein
MIVKRTDTAAGWMVYHRSTNLLILNSTSSEFGVPATAERFGDDTNVIAPTSSVFTLGTNDSVNATGGTYVAYLFAHNAGGFGLTGTDNVISCGTFEGTANTAVTLGYEPQWILVKSSSGGSNWQIIDTMRGMVVGSAGPARLNANTSGAESDNNLFSPTATGFVWTADAVGNDYIYIAIRRGPMKVPTLGTSVFEAKTFTGTGDAVEISSDLSQVDFHLATNRNGSSKAITDRLRGPELVLTTNTTNAEAAGAVFLDRSKQYRYTGASGSGNLSGEPHLHLNFKRAPSFFDEVCYTGNGVAGRGVTHNLGAAPELVIIKVRNQTFNWLIGSNFTNTNYLDSYFLTTTNGQQNYPYNLSAKPDSTNFYVESYGVVNGSGNTYVAYLFATCAGVSKCFSYTGNGSSQTINCGFTGGARFVLIKRTDDSGDWYVWDSARGIVSGNDPHLSLNSTAAEVTTDDTIDTDSTGFVVNQVSATNVNVSSATYIGLAIA